MTMYYQDAGNVNGVSFDAGVGGLMRGTVGDQGDLLNNSYTGRASVYETRGAKPYGEPFPFYGPSG